MKKIAWTLAATILMSVATYAQGGPPPGRGPHDSFGREGFGPRPWKVVKGLPYSADVTDQTVQTLADGNTIQRTTTGHIARDPEGRTYVQQTMTGGPLAQNSPKTVIFISDPVAGYSYALNPATKIAIKRAIKTQPVDADGPGPRESHPDSANRVEAELGTQVINGVNAQGKSVTHTIPAGEMGNAQPIVSKSETWYSPDLQIPVLAKRNDARFGQSTYSVNNIQRGDPSPTLFQVPSDYVIKDASTMRHDRGGPPPVQ